MSSDWPTERIEGVQGKNPGHWYFFVVRGKRLSLKTCKRAGTSTHPVSELPAHAVRAPFGTSFVNPIDFLQAYLSGTIRDVFVEGDNLRFTLGRQTMDLGSRRIVARNRFRNTINALTGLRLDWSGTSGEKLQGFFTFPVQRRSNSIRREDPRFDIERTGTLFWGIHLRSRPWLGSLHGEFQLYGLHETDADDYRTNDRRLITPGFRVFRTPRPGLTDIEIETFVQAGLSRLSSLVDDVTDLSHFAFFVHASLGRTFATGWQPRLVLKYDYASGDEDPNDDANGRFDTLFGARRFEYGPTGIYGAFKRSNINSPGIRFEFAPPRNIDGFLGYRAVWLAQARDVWTTTGIRDADGSSGSFLGHQFEGRLRWKPFERHATLEAGFARLWLGHFPRNAPNGLPDAKDPFYVYVQVILRF